MIRFADGIHGTLNGKGNIVVVSKDGNRASITDVFYVPSMTSNLISISQLLSKGYNMKLEENMVKLYNGECMMIMKALLADHKTFKVEISTVDHHLASTVVEDKNWLWHHMYGHPNFKGLGMLNQKKVVYGLAQVKEPCQVCEECCKAK